MTVGALQLVFEEVPADSQRHFRQRVAWKDGQGDHSALLALEEYAFRKPMART